MTWLIKFTLIFVMVVPLTPINGSPRPSMKFDEFGDINCEDEMARLDNYAFQLKAEPTARGVIMYYGGTTFRGRLPKRGEAATRAARLKPYLVDRRGLPSSRVIVINGGYRTQWIAELWILPKGMSLPRPFDAVKADTVKFRKGKASPRDFRCQI
jgi:hypothetical protein